MLLIRSFTALMLLITVSVFSNVIKFQDNQAFVLDEHQATLGTDFHNFQDWILAKNPASPKKALIENTILNIHYPTTSTIDWAKAEMSSKSFDNQLKNSIKSIPLVVTSVSGNYDYTPDNAFWVDFANAKSFGGGFRSNGNVQEERMFMEFPQLAQLAYAKRGNPILPVSKNCKLPREIPSCAEPFLIFEMLRRFDISKVPYGRAILDVKASQIPKDIETLSKPYAIANIIGLAAIDWCDAQIKKKTYTLSDLKYLLSEALLGNL